MISFVVLFLGLVYAQQPYKECRLNRLFVPHNLELKDFDIKMVRFTAFDLREDILLPPLFFPDPVSEALEWVSSQERPGDFSVGFDGNNFRICKTSFNLFIAQLEDCYKIPNDNSQCPLF